MERLRSVETKGSRAASGAALRRDDITDALVRAFFAEWARVGYRQLSLERVARSAGSGKAALYRRWSDKEAMATALLPEVGLTISPVDDAGSLDRDIVQMLRAIRRILRHPVIRRVVVDIHAELERNPALERAVRPFQDARRARAMTIVDRAVRRGEMSAAADREIAADLLAAPLYWRMVVLGRRTGSGHLERLAASLGAAMRAL